MEPVTLYYIYDANHRFLNVDWGTIENVYSLKQIFTNQTEFVETRVISEVPPITIVIATPERELVEVVKFVKDLTTNGNDPYFIVPLLIKYGTKDHIINNYMDVSPPCTNSTELLEILVTHNLNTYTKSITKLESTNNISFLKSRLEKSLKINLGPIVKLDFVEQGNTKRIHINDYSLLFEDDRLTRIKNSQTDKIIRHTKLSCPIHHSLYSYQILTWGGGIRPITPTSVIMCIDFTECIKLLLNYSSLTFSNRK